MFSSFCLPTNQRFSTWNQIEFFCPGSKEYYFLFSRVLEAKIQIYPANIFKKL